MERLGKEKDKDGGERVLTEWEEGETERKIDKGESQER